MVVCLFFSFFNSYAGFSSGEQERFVSKMLPHLYLHHLNFDKIPKCILDKLHIDISTANSDRVATRT